MNERMIQSHTLAANSTLLRSLLVRGTHVGPKPGQLTASHWICSLRKKKKKKINIQKQNQKRNITYKSIQDEANGEKKNRRVEC